MQLRQLVGQRANESSPLPLQEAKILSWFVALPQCRGD
jgi:hypothetical protein